MCELHYDTRRLWAHAFSVHFTKFMMIRPEFLPSLTPVDMMRTQNNTLVCILKNRMDVKNNVLKYKTQ